MSFKMLSRFSFPTNLHLTILADYTTVDISSFYYFQKRLKKKYTTSLVHLDHEMKLWGRRCILLDPHVFIQANYSHTFGLLPLFIFKAVIAFLTHIHQLMVHHYVQCHSCQHGPKKMRDVLLISLAFT